MTRPKHKFSLLVAMLALLALACSITIPAAPTVPQITPQQPSAPVSAPKVEPPGQTSAPVAIPIIATSEDELLVELYKRINPAVVNILTYTQAGSFLESSGQGSGFVFDTLGNIVTNSHVVHGSDSIEIVFSDNTSLEGRLVGEDLHSDLAVVNVAQLPAGANPLPLADFNSIAVGQTVIAIGNPFGLGGTLTRGIVSALGRTIPALTAFSIPQAIQTDAPINPGNSGGPLLNLRGEVIGVNAQIETGDGSRVNSGVGFAIPVSIVSRVVPELITDGRFQWSWLGVTGGSLNLALVEAMGLPVKTGAYISSVIDDGPADEAGLRGTTSQDTYDGRPVEIGGDVIIAIDGVAVSSFEDILIYIALNGAPGQTVTLTIIRDGQQQDVSLVLGARPDELNSVRP